METNPEIALAEEYINTTGVSIFLTGKAGTGKTTFLHHIVSTVRKRTIVVAPTGVAAINAGGVTIHSFFQLPFCPYLPDVKELVTEYQLPESKKQLRKSKVDIIRTLELLIIDEISMVRADLLDAVDAILRRYRRNNLPFGGVQLLMIGDVQQLPPVVTDEEKPYMERVYPSPFFFHAKALQHMPYVTICLQTIYRQQDQTFVQLLNNVRDNRFDPDTVRLLNSRLRSRAEVKKMADEARRQHRVPPVQLTTHNFQADEVNTLQMLLLSSEERVFDGTLQDNFPESSVAADLHLRLKIGAQVMFVKNDSSGDHRYYNGKIGTVESFIEKPGAKECLIGIVDDQGTHIELGREVWENIRYEIDPDDNQIKQVVDGSYTQYPLRLAWAITIHKAQGLTFDKVVVDAAAAFSYGQVYVALSRCRSLEGLTLVSPINENVAFSCQDISDFIQSLPSEQQVRTSLPLCQQNYVVDLVCQLFDCNPLHPLLGTINRIYQTELFKLYPTHTQNAASLVREWTTLEGVSVRFQNQLRSLFSSSDPAAQSLVYERIRKGTDYFFDQLSSFSDQLLPLMNIDIDNKELSRQMDTVVEQVNQFFGLRMACLLEVKKHGFSVEGYQKAKTDFLLEKNKSQKRRKAPVPALYDDVQHPDLVPMLKEWRKDTSAELNVAPFQIMSQKTLLAIADTLPKSEHELLQINGIGKIKLKMFGPDILRVIALYCDQKGIPFPRTQEMDF